MPAKPLPPVELLRSRYAYDPETGDLTVRKTGKVVLGGRRKSVQIDHGKFLVSRVIWKLMTGDDPPALVDHADLDPSNDRWRNLRDATYSQNSHNRHAHYDNRSGYKGVKRLTKPNGRVFYQAGMRLDGAYIHIGTYATAKEAHEAYKIADVKYLGEFSVFYVDGTQ